VLFRSDAYVWAFTELMLGVNNSSAGSKSGRKRSMAIGSGGF
jgi:hypothetical protein